jgi:hypothetical protein
MMLMWIDSIFSGKGDGTESFDQAAHVDVNMFKSRSSKNEMYTRKVQSFILKTFLALGNLPELHPQNKSADQAARFARAVATSSGPSMPWLLKRHYDEDGTHGKFFFIKLAQLILTLTF